MIGREPERFSTLFRALAFAIFLCSKYSASAVYSSSASLPKSLPHDVSLFFRDGLFATYDFGPAPLASVCVMEAFVELFVFAGSGACRKSSRAPCRSYGS